MATFAGSSSFDIAYDDVRQHECSPCSLGGRTKDAKRHCIDCPHYLCDDCKSYHGNLVVTRNNTIVSVSRIPGSASDASSLGVTCGCNKSHPLAFYCNDHKDIFCGACKTSNRHTCKTLSIQEKSLSYKPPKLNSILAEMRSLTIKYESLRQESNGNKKEVNRMKEACREEIKNVRKELDTDFDNLERNVLTELDTWKQSRCHVDQNVSTVAAAMDVLRVDCKRLEDAERDVLLNKEAMFIAEVQVSKSIHSFPHRLADLEKNIETPILAFERNELLADLVAGISTLGSLKCQRKGDERDNTLPGNTASTRMLLDRKIKSRIEVYVSNDDDWNGTWISGNAERSCCVM